MLDRVREALFSTLGDLVPGARVLDLFAGTGSLGLEALSRGAAGVRFVERDRGAAALLERNVELLRVAEAARVVVGDALERSSWTEAEVEAEVEGEGEGAGEGYELVFLDPPYRLLEARRTRLALLEAASRLFGGPLEPGGALVVHAHRRDLDASDFGEIAAERRVYGSSALWYLWKQPEAP